MTHPTSTSAVEAKIEAVMAALEPKCRGFGHGNLPTAIAREFATAAVSALATLDQGDGHASDCAEEVVPDGWAIAPWKVGRVSGESDDAYKARAEATGATHGLSAWGELHEFSHRAWSLERASHATPGWVGVRRAPIPVPGASWTDDELEPAARALFESTFKEETWEDCPGLHDDVFASLRAAIAKLPIASLNATPGAPSGGEEVRAQIDPKRMAEVMSEGDGVWRTCSGCHESEDGYDVGFYPHSDAFGCKLGGGCGECGGLGAIWDETDYEALGRALSTPSAQGHVEPSREAHGDDFNGDTPRLIDCIRALVDMSDEGVLLPHGLGGHARKLLLAAANRLAPQAQGHGAVGAGWRPIDKSTPRDGTHILLSFGQDLVAEGWWEDDDSDAYPWKFLDTGCAGSDFKAGELINGNRDEKYGPSHWQPMPEPWSKPTPERVTYDDAFSDADAAPDQPEAAEMPGLREDYARWQRGELGQLKTIDLINRLSALLSPSAKES